MSTYLFSLAMSQVSDRYVEEALTYQAAVRTRRRVWLRYLGAACLTLVLGFGLALTVSADTRDAVFGWIKEQLRSFTHYEYVAEETEDDSQAEAAPPRYYLSNVPEGYVEASYTEDGYFQMCIWFHPDNGMMVLAISSGDGSHFFVQEEAAVQTVQVGDGTGDLYLPADPEEESGLIWTVGDTIFYMSGHFTPEEMVALAESVKHISEEAEISRSREPAYVITALPEEYVREDYRETQTSVSVTFRNGKGGSVALIYGALGDTAYSAEEYTGEYVTIGDAEGVLYTPVNPGNESVLVWAGEDSVQFKIESFLSGEEIIALAESVQRVEE